MPPPALSVAGLQQHDASTGGKPAHLQPLDGGTQAAAGWHPPAAPAAGSNGGSIPTTPKSNLGPHQAAVAARSSAAGALPHSSSEVSMVSVAQSLQAGQQQQQQQQQSDDDNIKVVVRVRPLNPQEQAKGAASVVQVAEDCNSLQVVVPSPGGATMKRDFSFHACLGPDISQAEVMDLCGIHQLLDAALAGYHVTIFAYGQTGSGKTHTMSGRDDDAGEDTFSGHEHDGIVSRAVQYLFHQVNTCRDAKYALKASYLEIYNEGVRDLVHFSAKAKSLPVKWDAAYGFYVQGLKVVPCSQQRTMSEVIATGLKHRKVGSHQLNIESSRSHAIFTVYCDATPTDPSSYDFGTIRYGKVSFVDLAGSERVKDSRSEGSVLKETININKSLSVLGKVILALAEQGASGTTAHVPYRDSKLTKLLMDSLGGTALTLMVACCSPSSLQVEETLSTLSYATRTKNIHNRPTVQYDPREAQIAGLRREIELLRQENILLKEAVRGGGGGSLGGSVPTTPDGSPHHHHQVAAAKLVLGGRTSVLNLHGSPGSAGSSTGTSPGCSPILGGPGMPARSPSPQVGAAEEAVAGLRSNSSPSMPRLPGMRLPASGGALGEQQLRASLNELDLRANAARHSAAGGGGGGSTTPGGHAGAASLTSSELLRRLGKTQSLLVKFSEENIRLSSDNQRLQAGRNALSVEHAGVLDEIDLLRGKLSQLEHSVLSVAAAATTPGEGDASAADGAQAGGGGAGTAAAAASAARSPAGGFDVRALLQSLGLGQEVFDALTAVGVGPNAAAADEDGLSPPQQQQQQQQQQPGSGGAWQIGASPAAGRSLRSATLLQTSSSTRSTSSVGSRAAQGPVPGSRSPSPASGLKQGAGATIINRTPLHNKAAALEPRDDSVTVGNPASLAVLLGKQGSGLRVALAAAPAAGGVHPSGGASPQH